MANPERHQQQLLTGWQAIERGDHGTAETIARALLRERLPGSTDCLAYNLLGVALMQQNRHEEALQVLARALERDRGLAGTHLNLGSALTHLGRNAEAIPHFAMAARIDPKLPQAHYNLGHVLKELGRFDEAAAAYRATLAVAPNFLLAHINLGFVLREQGQFDAAGKSFLAAAECDPECAEAHAQLGIVQRSQGRLREAVAHLERAVAIEDDHFPALNHLGAAYQEQGRDVDAVACFSRAIAVDPHSAEARHNLGVALQGLSRHDEAIACFREALRIEPSRKYTLGALLWSQRVTCSWEGLDSATAELRESVRRGQVLAEPFVLTAISPEPQEQLLCARAFCGDRVKGGPPLWRGECYRHGKIRVAYLSGDFREHAVAYCTAELFALHDRSLFDVIGVSYGVNDGSPMRAAIERSFDRFVDIRAWNDTRAAQMLRDLEVDIAVDLTGYTRGFRTGIFAQRAAPIQVGYLGYPGTSGADFIDYLIADRFVIPEADLKYYSEKVVYLPDTYMVNPSRRVMAEPAPRRADAGLPERGFVFCCFNNSYKVAPGIYAAWMRLLSKVDDGVLWLSTDNASAQANLRMEAVRAGVDPRRLVFAPFAKAIEQHYARLHLGDLFLDTPYNGHVTTSDALWAGLPVLTWEGRTFAGRVAGSLLRAVGLPELITRDLGEYEERALELARDRARLAELRGKLAHNRGSAPLFDTDRFRRHLESAYRGMWGAWQRGEPSRSFSVEPIS